MKKNLSPSKIIVDVFNLADEADREIYQNLLKQNEDEAIKITRDEFIYDKMGTPKITIWYEKY